ncbi:hypothetical protein QL285_071636 [Trifolium repens]|nr:hypothetical protein QL285_071636 [Trifolium repens]
MDHFIRVCGIEDEEFKKCDNISGYMVDNREERNVNEDMSSYNSRRVQDGGYMDRARNQIATGLIENRNIMNL